MRSASPLAVVTALGALVVVTLAGCRADPPSPAGTPGAASRPVPTQGTLPQGALGLKWGWAQTDDVRAQVDALSGGATFHELSWCAVEGPAGQRDWRPVDRALQHAQRTGYELMLKLRTGSCSLTGQTLTSGHPRKSPSVVPADTARYLAFVRETASRYAPLGVRTFAIENEIDAENFWGPAPERYAEIAPLVADAVRDAAPGVHVIDSGLSSSAYGAIVPDALLSAGRPDRALSWYREFHRLRHSGGRSRFPAVADAEQLRRVLDSPRARRAVEAWRVTVELAQRGVFDAYQLHWYEPSVALPEALALLREQLPAALPVEAWEFGLAWPGEGYEPEAHGAEIAKTLWTLVGTGVQRAVYLPVQHDPGGAFPDEIWRGLLDAAGRPRPAATVLNDFAALLRDGAVDWRAVLDDRLRGLELSDGAETTALVWSEREAVRLEASAVREARDPLGRPAAVAWADGGLLVGRRPVLVALAAGAELPGAAA